MDARQSAAASANRDRDSRWPARLLRQPFRALLTMLGLGVPCYFIVGVLIFGVLRLPNRLTDLREWPTVAFFTAGHLLAFLVVPFALRLPGGSRSFRRYLDDIRLTRVRPAGRLAALTLSCLAILIACQGTGSVVYQSLHGQALTAASIARIFDLGSALPPRSSLLFRQMFSSLEEVAFRGVFLTLLLRRYPQGAAIAISAAAFGILHLPGALTGVPPVFAAGQVTFAFLYGLFYGYLFVRSGSLLPPMTLHWLSNVVQSPLTAAWDAAPIVEHTLYSVVFGYGLAAILSIAWVRIFAARWLTGQPSEPPVAETRTFHRSE